MTTPSDPLTPAADVDDPDVPDAKLPRADRDAIRDVAAALVKGDLAMTSDTFTALPARIRRRAWLRYQQANEDDEPKRERRARQTARELNDAASIEQSRLEERRQRRDRERLDTERELAERAQQPGDR